MLGELPKLFGKGFLIGYFFPSVIIVAALCAVLDLMGVARTYSALGSALFASDEKQLAVRFGIALAILWAISTVLLVANFLLIRTLEGYGALNPANLWRGFALTRFERMTARLDAIVRAAAPSAQERRERQDLRLRLAAGYPEQRELVLPTRLGNIIRAFERYPQVVYNIEPITIWIRLQPVIPDSYRGFLDDAKTMLDFFVNLWAGAIFVAIFTAGLSAYGSATGAPWAADQCAVVLVVIAAILAAFVAAKLAQGPAAQWGELVKGAFDLYRAELAKQLGLEVPRSIEHERRMWGVVCRTMIFRRAEDASGLTVYRPLGRDDD